MLAAVMMTLAGVATSAASAAAADTGSLTDVRTKDDAITGVLTVRTSSPLVDLPVRATVGGRSRPVELSNEVRAERTVMLVIDTSGSMGAAGMATVRAAVSGFLRSAPEDVQVGVTSFSTTSGVDLAPTTRGSRVQRMVDGLVSGGDTDLFGGVAAAVHELTTTAGDRSIVLLSDGADTVSIQSPQTLARTVRAVGRAGVRLDVVRFNTDDPAAVRSLSSLAAAGNGTVVAASDRQGVTRAFTGAASALESQVSFTVALPHPLEHRTPLVLSSTARGFSFVARGSAPPSGDARPSSGPPAATSAATERGADPGLSLDRTSWYALALAGAAVLAVALFLLGVAFLVPHRSPREQRVEAIENYLPWVPANGTRPPTPRPAAITAKLVSLGEQVAEGRKSTAKTLTLIRRADLRISAGEWLIVRAIAVVLPAAAALLLTGAWLFVAVGAVAGFVGPTLWLRFVASRRANKFERQLPDVLFLVASSLNTGFGLSQSVDAVVQDAPDPVATELGRAQAETRLGTDLPDALDRVAARMGSTTLGWTVMAMRIQAEVGGNLAETLRTTAQTLRDRESLHRQVRALTAEGRLSAYILIALPIFLFLYVYMVNRDYVSLLWSHPIGIGLSAVTVVLMGIGIVWMRKVVKVEV